MAKDNETKYSTVLGRTWDIKAMFRKLLKASVVNGYF